MFKRRYYSFGAQKNEISVKVFSKRNINSKHKSVYMEMFLKDGRKWKSQGAIPVLSIIDLQDAIRRCLGQVSLALRDAEAIQTR